MRETKPTRTDWNCRTWQMTQSNDSYMYAFQQIERIFYPAHFAGKILPYADITLRNWSSRLASERNKSRSYTGSVLNTRAYPGWICMSGDEILYASSDGGKRAKASSDFSRPSRFIVIREASTTASPQTIPSSLSVRMVAFRHSGGNDSRSGAGLVRFRPPRRYRYSGE